jgi:glycosyltransferase involved in cell wall biosynthesis
MPKPKLLMLSSSFPRNEVDQTCGYLRQLALHLSNEYEVTILTPASRGALSVENLGAHASSVLLLNTKTSTQDACAPRAFSEEQQGCLTVRRFNYFWPRRAQVLDSATDSLQTLRQRQMAKLVLVFYCAFFLWHAWRLGRRADVILSHWLIPAGLIGSMVSLLLGKPHIVVEHSGALRLLARVLGGRWPTRFVIGQSHRVVTVSCELYQRLVELCPAAAVKTTVIPMGIDAGDFVSRKSHGSKTEGRRPKADQHIVLYLGRLAEVKGISVLVQAVAGIENARLVIAGGGECERELKRLVNELNVSAVFLGPVNEKQKVDWLNRCQVVVIPSLILPDGQTEGLPVVCLEALAAGKPVVASCVGGLAEVIKDGENGFLVEPGHVSELQEKLSRLLSDHRLRLTMRAVTRRTAKRYDWRMIGRQFSEIIRAARQSKKS